MNLTNKGLMIKKKFKTIQKKKNYLILNIKISNYKKIILSIIIKNYKI